MTLKLIIFFFCLITAGVLGKNVRIIGGLDAQIKDFPFMVSIRMIPINLLVCGGVIISEHHVLSAAHCFFNNEKAHPHFRIYTGTSNLTMTRVGSIFEMKEIFIHPEYTGIKNTLTMNQHDICVIKVLGKIVFNQYQQKALLPDSNVYGGEIVILLGWGSTVYPKEELPKTLQKVIMLIMSNAICQKNFKFSIHSDQLCGFVKKGKGVCTGDSGGPLIFNEKVVGIVSTSQPCATGIPDIYTRVYPHLDFIKSILKNH